MTYLYGVELMNCENCGAPMAPVEGRNYMTCGYCHTFHFPTQLEDSADRIIPLHQSADLTCPVCCKQLASGAVDKVRMMYCDQCRGLLLTNDAFAEAVRDRRGRYTGLEQRPVPIDPCQYERRLGCPSCRGPMEVHPYHGPGNVVVDTCAVCRLIWLDHGELAAIERAPGQRKPAPPSYVRPLTPVPSQDKQDTAINLFDLLFS